jgi:hypothetical protein
MARSTILLPDGRNPRSKAAQDSVERPEAVA